VKSPFGIFSDIFLHCKCSTLLSLQVVVFDDKEEVNCTIVREDEFSDRSNDIRRKQKTRYDIQPSYIPK